MNPIKILILCLVFSLTGQAQNLKADLAKVAKSYKNLNKHVSIVARTINPENNKTVSSERFEHYMVNHSNYYMVLDFFEIRVDPQLTVTINREDKSISVDSTDESVNPMGLELVDSMTRFYNSIERSVISSTLVRYTLTPKYLNVQNIIIEIDSKKGHLTRFRINAKPESKRDLTVEYAYSYHPLDKSKMPSVNTIVSKSEGKWKLLNSYSDYTLIQ